MQSFYSWKTSLSTCDEYSASGLIGEKKECLFALRHAKLRIRNIWSLGCENFYQELRIPSKPALLGRSFWEDRNVSIHALSGKTAASHMWLLGTWNVTSSTEEMHFIYVINLNSHMWLYRQSSRSLLQHPTASVRFRIQKEHNFANDLRWKLLRVHVKFES